MSDTSVAESTEANSKPEALTVREAADRLLAKKQVSQADPEPQPDPEPAPNAEPAPEPVPEPAQTDDIDYSALDMSEVAAPMAEREPTDQTTDATPEPSFTLKHDGQEREVTRQEAIDLAQMGMDYRKKTQDLAEQRRAFEAQQSALNEQMQGLQQDRERLSQHLKTFTTDVQAPSPELAESDPDEFTAQMAKYQASQIQAEQVARELDEQREKDAKARQEQYRRWYGDQMNRLHTRVPDMAKKEVSHGVGRYLTEGLGFHPDELLQGVINPGDARFQEISYKAMMFDQSRAKAAKLKAKPPKTSTGQGRSGTPSDVEKPTGKLAQNPRAVAEWLAQRKRGQR